MIHMPRRQGKPYLKFRPSFLTILLDHIFDHIFRPFMFAPRRLFIGACQSGSSALINTFQSKIASLILIQSTTLFFARAILNAHST
jgi:hypothetical protein